MGLIDLLKKLKPADDSVDISDFTPRAQQALLLARQEAVRLRQNYIGTEHILLGLIKLGQGVAVSMLRHSGLRLENVRTEAEKLAGPKVDDEMVGNPKTPGTRRVLEMAKEEARALDCAYIGTESILLALMREREGAAAEIFKKFRLDVEQLHNEILKILKPRIDGGQKS